MPVYPSNALTVCLVSSPSCHSCVAPGVLTLGPVPRPLLPLFATHSASPCLHRLCCFCLSTNSATCAHLHPPPTHPHTPLTHHPHTPLTHPPPPPTHPPPLWPQVVITQLQALQRHGAAVASSASTLSVAASIWREGGPLGFFKVGWGGYRPGGGGGREGREGGSVR